MTLPSYSNRLGRRLRIGLLLAVFGASLALAGCGFQLRGTGNDSGPIMQHLLLQVADDTPQNELARELRRRLESAGVSIDPSARLQLNLGAANYSENQLGYGGSGGNQERELILRVPYSVQRVFDGAYLVDQQYVESRGSYSTSTSQLLQRDDERTQLRLRLAGDAAQQLIERMRALSASPLAEQQ